MNKDISRQGHPPLGRSHSSSHQLCWGCLTPRSQIKKYCAPAGGMVLALVPVGSLIKAGQPLYRVLSFNKDGNLPTVVEVFAEGDGLIYDISLNQAVNEGEYVLATM